MICKKFDELNSLEKIEFFGKLNHAAQSDDRIFDLAQSLISAAERIGLLDNVKFITSDESKEEIFSSNSL